jgi:hypothetical protein
MLVNKPVKIAEGRYFIYHGGLNLGHITNFNVL